MEAGTTSIALHAFRLDIDAAYVGGELCDCHTSPWWDEVLQDSGRYKACLLREVQPELVIDVRTTYFCLVCQISPAAMRLHVQEQGPVHHLNSYLRSMARGHLLLPFSTEIQLYMKHVRVWFALCD